MHKKRFLFALSLSILSLYSAGQDFVFKRYTASEGLVNDVIIQLMEDSNGFLWIATASGISRFDGKNFKNYGYSEGLTGLVVYKIYEDAHHRLWLGTSKGIAELRGSRFKIYSDTGPGETIVSNFGEYPDYGLIAFSDSGTYVFDDHEQWIKKDLLPEYKENFCADILAADGGLYMNYDRAIIFKKKNEPAKILLNDTVINPYNFCNGIVKSKGQVYAGIGDRIFQLHPDGAEAVIQDIPINRFFNYTVDTSGIFWINSAGKGLFRYRVVRGKGVRISAQEYDSNTSGYPLIDSQGNVWISSFEGLIKVTRKVFQVVTPPREAGASKRINIIPGKNREVIVSDASGLQILNDNIIEHLQRPASYKDETSYGQDIVEGYGSDNRENTWMITRQRKMLCWNGSRMLDYSHLLVPRTTDYIRNLTVNQTNNMVFICDDSTLICGNENGFAPFVDRKGNTFSKTTTVLFTHHGIGLVNVYSKGLYFITRGNEIMKAPKELDIIDKGDFTYFFEDGDGWVWISNAGKGLVRFRIDENDYSVKDLSVLTTDQGLPSNKIVYLVFDQNQNAWVSCSNGIVVLRPNANNKKVWDVFPVGSEQNIRVQPPVTMISDKHNNVWLASINDLTKIDVSKMEFKTITPNVVIEKVMLNMKETDWTTYADSVSTFFQLPKKVSLDHRQNTLAIECAGISLYNAEGIEYAYQVAPVDTTWSAPTSNRMVSLVKLAPGHYSFKVKARGKGTAWSSPAVFDFTVRSPFWDTWWFKLLIILVAASIVIGIYLNRIRKIQQRADLQHQMLELEMKALKAQMKPHFIYNALNSIQALIADDQKEKAINYIGRFSRLLRQVLDFSDNTVIALDKELQALDLYVQLESLRLNMQLEYNVSYDDIIPENERVPPLILQPFVENAIWHGLSKKEGLKQLKLSIEYEDHMLVCVVEDNGIGRSQAASVKKESYSSKGIGITTKRLIDFNGNGRYPIEYEDLIDEAGNAGGTRVSIRIKRSFNKSDQRVV